jgi:formylglycine-generating enzyme required for sulfatase activity
MWRPHCVWLGAVSIAMLGLPKLAAAQEMVGPKKSSQQTSASQQVPPKSTTNPPLKAPNGQVLRPGQQFHDTLADGSVGPQMVVVPGGQFVMGSPNQEGDRARNEGPTHVVRLKSFAMGRTEVTRGEFAKFALATGYKTDAERNTALTSETHADGCFVFAGAHQMHWEAGANWRNPGFAQDDNHPVTCLSWNDATAYVEWLRRQTHKRYRLPSEAEQEYSIRAGSGAPWAWGSDPNGGCAMANGADESEARHFGSINAESGIVPSRCDDGYVFTAPVGRFKPNAFGLYDTVGNVFQWSQDCFHPNYSNTPQDGSAADNPNCTVRVLRGGSWGSGPTWLRSARRYETSPANRDDCSGLRVAEDI